MWYELTIALRYTRSRSRNHFISFISFASIAGVALGVAALIVVLSVMNGFEQELRSRILGVLSHVTVSSWRGELANWRQTADLLGKDRTVLGVAPYVDIQALLVAGGKAEGAMVRGILPDQEQRVSDYAVDSLGGKGLAALADLRYGIILGRELAASLGVAPGDNVTLMIPQVSVTPVGVAPRMRRFQLVGTLTSGMHEYDSALALIHLPDAQRLLRLEDRVSGLKLKLTDLMLAPLHSRKIAEAHRELAVTDWTRQHANFFRAVQTEKTTMAIILSLIVAVAAFNIVSTLVMVVQDKASDIAVLRTMGATSGSIMTIFILLGSMIGVVGTLAGAVLGVVLAENLETVVAWLERLLGVDFWDETVYYISDLVARVRWQDVGWIVLVSFSICLLSTLYPAWRAARTDPVQALRYE